MQLSQNISFQNFLLFHNSKVGKNSYIILANESIIQTFYNFLCWREWIIQNSSKNIYDIFHSFSWHYQAKFNPLPYIYFILNGSLAQVIQFWLIHTIHHYLSFPRSSIFTMFSLHQNHKRSNSQYASCNNGLEYFLVLWGISDVELGLCNQIKNC